MTDAAFKPDITLTRALAEPSLFGRTFSAPSFWTWKVVAKLIDGIPLTEPREIELFQAMHRPQRSCRTAMNAVRCVVSFCW